VQVTVYLSDVAFPLFHFVCTYVGLLYTLSILEGRN